MARARAEDLRLRGNNFIGQDDYTSALSVLQEAERISQGLSTKDILRGKILHSLGLAEFTLGHLQEGEQHLGQSLEIKRSCLPANHSDTAITMKVLGECLRQQQKLEEAEQMLRQAVEMQTTVNETAQTKAMTMYHLGECLRQQQKFDEAEQMFRQTLEIETTANVSAASRATTMWNLAVCLHHQQKYDEAEQMFRQNLEIQTTVNAPAAAQANVLDWLMLCLNKQGKYEKTEEEFLKFSTLEELPQSNATRCTVISRLEASLRAQGKLEKLRELQRTGKYTTESCAQQQVPSGLRSSRPQATGLSTGESSRQEESRVQQSSTSSQEVTDARKRLQEQEEITQIVTQENVRLQQQNEQLQQQNSQVQQERHQLQQEKNELQQGYDHLNHEMEQLRDQLATATQPSAASGGTPTRLARRLREAEEKLEEYESVLTIAEQDVHMTTTRLGGGAFGEVFAAVWRGVPVAVKKFYEALLEVTDHNVDLVRQEISVCSRVHHPNIVSICGAITAGGLPLRLVMELLEASLSEVMAASRASGKYLSLREQIDLAVDCLCGMLYLHKLRPPLLHGDIRPTNILVTMTMEAKIGDLGTAHVMGGSLSCGPVSLDYLAPERMPRRDNTAIHNTQEADVYSLGVTLAEIFTGQQASRRSRQKQLSMISRQLLEDVCCDMTEDAANDRITVAAALERVSPVEKEGDYQQCPAKRMVKGKLHGVQKPMLVHGPWQ